MNDVDLLNAYCRRDDVFIGFGALGVVRQPEDRDYEWLNTHCWVCGRSADEITAARR